MMYYKLLAGFSVLFLGIITTEIVVPKERKLTVVMCTEMVSKDLTSKLDTRVIECPKELKRTVKISLSR